MSVPFLDLGAAYAELAPELDAAYREVMDSGRFLFGPQLEGFEAEFGDHAGAKECVGVGSGLDALALSLRALGVETGDEVLVPTHTSALTWLAVLAVGAIPVGVEPDENTYTLDPDRLDSTWNRRTRAVVPVHIYGRPAEMHPILDWAAVRGVAVLADAAQAHGARLSDRPVGALGDAVAWSFYPSKNLGAFADAGCVTTDSGELAARIRRLRNYGSAARDELVEIGTNSRLDELQAAFLRVRLGRLDDWNERRRATARRYLELLDGLPLGLPPCDDEVVLSAWHQFVVRLGNGRDRIRAELAERDIETLIHYSVPPFAQPLFAGLGVEPGSFPVAERLAGEVLSLPVGPHLDADAARQVVEALAETL